MLLRCLVLFSVLWLSGVSVSVQAGEQPREVAGKPAAKLLGTWHSAHGAITFQPNGIIVYQGKRHYYAAGNGVIQITHKRIIRNLPYKLFDGKLTITDNGVDTVYTRE